MLSHHLNKINSLEKRVFLGMDVFLAFFPQSIPWDESLTKETSFLLHWSDSGI